MKRKIICVLTLVSMILTSVISASASNGNLAPQALVQSAFNYTLTYQGIMTKPVTNSSGATVNIPCHVWKCTVKNTSGYTFNSWGMYLSELYQGQYRTVSFTGTSLGNNVSVTRTAWWDVNYGYQTPILNFTHNP